MLTFKNIQDNVLSFLDQVGDTGHGLDLVKLAINTVHSRRLSAERWSFMLWPNLVALQFQTGVRVYSMHPLAMMLTDFTNETAKQQMHETPSRARYKSGVQDDRYHFEFVHESPVKTPFTQGVLTVAGSAQLYYVDTSGNDHVETVTNASTTFAVDVVVGVTKLTAATLTITDTTPQTILSLAALEYGKSYPQIRLFDNGVSSEVGKYRFYRRPKTLTLDNDIPDIPFPFSNVLIYDALLELYTYNDDAPPQYWVAQQGLWERQMQQAYQEGEMEGAESRTVQDVDLYQG